jgi:hypothetical protein
MVQLPQSRLKRARHVAGALALQLSSLGSEAKDPAEVIVIRRSDGATLATFHHDYLAEAVNHRDSLCDRLRTEHIFDMCRELGIDMMQVGPPQDG